MAINMKTQNFWQNDNTHAISTSHRQVYGTKMCADFFIYRGHMNFVFLFKIYMFCNYIQYLYVPIKYKFAVIHI